MKCLPLTLVILGLGVSLACQAQQAPPWEIHALTPQSVFESRGDTNVFTHGVVLSNQTAVVTADSGVGNDLTGEVVAEGDVTIFDRNHIWRGTNVVYNFRTGDVFSREFKTMQGPFALSGENLIGNSNQIYFATNAFITTDDYAKPAYHIRARRIIIVPGVFFEAHEATLFWGKVPVFYYPVYKRYFGRHPNYFEFLPGDRSTFGPYVLGSYHWYGDEVVDGAVHFDVRAERGLAGGPDLNLHLGDAGEAAFKYYYAHDDNPNTDDIGVVPHVGENRQRAGMDYEAIPTPSSNLTVKVIANYQSDPTVLRDFFESEYRANVQPKTYGEVDQLWPNFSLNFMAQPQIVHFFETVERLPDVKLTGLRQEVGATPIYYQSESSVGYYERAFSDTNLMGTNYSGMRADTFHQFLLPENFFGWLNVTPRVGGRYTYYGDVYGTQERTNEQGRGVFSTGMDVSFKLSKVWKDSESDFWDLHEMRHIIEPDFDYAFTPAPTRSPLELPQYDTQIPSLRQLPLEFPDYNSIDAIDKQDVLRLSLRNKLQTKRADGIEDFVNWAVYTDWNLNPGTNHAFSDAYSDLDFRPRSWITLNSDLHYDLVYDRWLDTVNRLVLQPNNSLSITLSHRYLMNNDPIFVTSPTNSFAGHNLFSVSIYYRINENWGARISERFEAQDGTLQEQMYSIQRDLRAWTGALTIRVAQGRNQPTDFSIGFMLSLKAFPRFTTGSDSDHPGLLMESATAIDPMDPAERF